MLISQSKRSEEKHFSLKYKSILSNHQRLAVFVSSLTSLLQFFVTKLKTNVDYRP